MDCRSVYLGRVNHAGCDRTGLGINRLVLLLLLASISWLVTLTQPLFSFRSFTFSARDLIMLFGGFFLLFKATMELNERLEGKDSNNPTQRKGAKFWGVVTQIVVLDAIFSLDSVITAVGMVDHLLVMMAAVVIAISLMLMASKPLTQFVNRCAVRAGLLIFMSNSNN